MIGASVNQRVTGVMKGGWVMNPVGLLAVRLATVAACGFDGKLAACGVVEVSRGVHTLELLASLMDLRYAHRAVPGPPPEGLGQCVQAAVYFLR